MRRKNRYRPALELLESRALLSTYYVAPTGADGASGSAQAPWQTLQHAANLVQPGDTVIVEPGTYAGFDLTTGGTAGSPITFQAQPGVVVNRQNPVTQDGINLEGASYITIEGFTVDNVPRAGIRAVTDEHVTIINNDTDHNGWWGIFSGFSNYIDIENNTTSNSQIQHGIYVSNSAVAPIIRNNIVFGNADNGIHLNGDISEGGSGMITSALIVGNIVHDNGADGGSAINCDGVQNSVIENNVLYNNHASGISLYQIDAAAGSTNNLVTNNTIIMASDARWALNIQNASTGNVVLNNILFDQNSAHGALDISADSLPGFVSDYNIVANRFTTTGGDSSLTLPQWQAATGQDQHSSFTAGSSLFVNTAGNDYHLASSSPAINAGSSSLAGDAAPTMDRDGNPRPSNGGYDIGAYQVPASAPAPAPLPSTPQGLPTSQREYIATGADAGGGPVVQVYNASTGALLTSFFAYSPSFTGGVRVAVGDVNGDGVPDVVTAPGAGGGSDIHVYDGRSGQLIRDFFAFDPAFTGGVNIAVGDVNGDGYGDIIVGADSGGGPNVIVFSGRDNTVLDNFFAYDPSFTGGVRVAAGDTTGTGRANIITAPGPGGGPFISIFDGLNGAPVKSFFAFSPGFTGGVYVAAGDVNGDGRADILAGAGGTPNVAVFSGLDGSMLTSFFAFDPGFSGGVRVAAVNTSNGADILASSGPTGTAQVRIFNGTAQQIDDFYAFSPQFQGGLYVAAG